MAKTQDDQFKNTTQVFLPGLKKRILLLLVTVTGLLLILFQNFSVSTAPSVTPDTFVGKNFVGYQGWFHTPNDGFNRGWSSHWGAPTSTNLMTLDPTRMFVDMWPDLSEYSANSLEPTGLTLKNGNPAAAFSSFNDNVIDLHFRWMKQYGIDGIYLQWFLVDPAAERLAITKKIKDAAERYSRQFVISFDISGTSDPKVPECNTGQQLVNCLKSRWMSAVDAGIVASPMYMTFKAKPILLVWGLGFPHNGNFTAQDVLNFMSWLKSSTTPVKYQASIMGGVPWAWRTLGDGENAITTDKALWQEAYSKLDIISPWNAGSYADDSQAQAWIQGRAAADINFVRQKGQSYVPVIFPGFSWKNLSSRTANPGILNQIPRRGGQFMWTQAREYAQLGISSFYTAMFDEVDEGTAIFKTAATQSTSPKEFDTLTLDADGQNLPSDWYLRLSYGISIGLKSQKLSGFSSPTPLVPAAPAVVESKLPSTKSEVIAIINALLIE